MLLDWYYSMFGVHFYLWRGAGAGGAAAGFVALFKLRARMNDEN